MIQAICLGPAVIDMVALEAGVALDSPNAYVAAPGGSSANVAVGLSKLGVRTAFVGKVGDDAFGSLLEKTLRQNGVDTSGMSYSKEARTTLVFISERDGGILFYRNPGADMLLSCDEIDEGMFKEASLLHFDTVCMSHEPACSAMIHAIELARRHRLFISFDVNYRADIWENPEVAKERARYALERSDFVKLSLEELEFLFETTDMEKGSETVLAQSDKIQLAAVTAGEGGSFARTRNASKFVDAAKVTCVDATGCGDAFVAAIISRLMHWNGQGKTIAELSADDLEQALRFANVAGGFTARNKGVIPALPDSSELEDFVRRGFENDPNAATPS